MMNDDVVVSGASGRETVEDLRRSGALECGLAAELSEHLGYEKGQTSAQARSNTRNGTTKKTVMLQVGAFEIEVPREEVFSIVLGSSCPALRPRRQHAQQEGVRRDGRCRCPVDSPR